jgi:hypothetical protein
MDDVSFNLKLKPLIPSTGGGLSGEAHLYEERGEKRVVRVCNNEERAIFYERLCIDLSKYKILPKFIMRRGKYVFLEFLEGRDLGKNENLEVFKHIGRICAIINNLEINNTPVDINKDFFERLDQLNTGNYPKYSKKEYEEKKRRRPNETHDIGKIVPLISLEEKNRIINLNKKLMKKFKQNVTLDTFDVSPANFRLSKGKVYFVDLDAIKPKLKGMGVIKCMFGWAEKEEEREALLSGYYSKYKGEKFSEEYQKLLELHFLIQALHDRAKLGRSYDKQLKKLKELMKINQ